jgi:hypothetical protein
MWGRLKDNIKITLKGAVREDVNWDYMSQDRVHDEPL